MTALLIGYARVSTDAQDLTGTNRERPGLREAPAACREGNTLVVTKLDRPDRSLPDARAIAEELTVRQVRLSLSGSVYDPHDPVGRLLIDVLAMVAESMADVIRLRTRARTPCGALLPNGRRPSRRVGSCHGADQPHWPP
jgi:DNA invertase Pin-like site-specific DNA recombinase